MGRKILIYITILSLFGLFSIAIPKLFMNDSYNLSKNERFCVMFELGQLFDNPFERLQIINITIDDKRDRKVYTSVYTFWGLKFATAEVICDQGASLTWKR